MPDATLHAEGDAAARIEAARAEMIASATEAWDAIRAMEPSAERVELGRPETATPSSRRRTRTTRPNSRR